jgi:hypothetical protein
MRDLAYVLPKRIAYTGACLFEDRCKGFLLRRVADDIGQTHARVILANVFLLGITQFMIIARPINDSDK